MQLASIYGHIDVAKFLITNGANIHVKEIVSLLLVVCVSVVFNRLFSFLLLRFDCFAVVWFFTDMVEVGTHCLALGVTTRTH